MASDLIERNFHEQVWKTANDSSSVERAVSEGRDLAYVVLKLAEPDSGYAAHANHWLDKFGRDKRREEQLREDPQ